MKYVIGKKTPGLVLIAIMMMSSVAQPQSVEELDRRASEFYKNKEFTRALGEWLRILEIEPDNENIQKKIEVLYEEKHRKDLAYQQARLHYRLARQELPVDVQKAKEDSDHGDSEFRNRVQDRSCGSGFADNARGHAQTPGGGTYRACQEAPFGRA
ncbi:MAG: hypothetical protein EHM32_10120 [Spirochaetales bacterium]|nr:MAG: hypothetical protein EHM32_10120 [Spirochaetales bacterium]